MFDMPMALFYIALSGWLPLKGLGGPATNDAVNDR
jgi:hypothetical protein